MVKRRSNGGLNWGIGAAETEPAADRLFPTEGKSCGQSLICPADANLVQGIVNSSPQRVLEVAAGLASMGGGSLRQAGASSGD